MFGVILTDPLLTHSSENGVFIGQRPFSTRNARTRKSVRYRVLGLIAGDGIRTHDVQLGKLAFYH